MTDDPINGDLYLTIAQLRDENARLKAELELETEVADRLARQVAALESVAEAARYLLSRTVALSDALDELDQQNADG